MAAEEAKLSLQAVIGDLDEETLQRLLQTAIANKAKDSSQHVIATSSSTETEVDQTVNNDIMKSDQQVENKDAIDSNVAGLEVQINVGIDGSEGDQPIKTHDDDLSQSVVQDEKEDGSHISPNHLEDTVPVLVSGIASSNEETDKESTASSQSPKSSANSLHVLQIKELQSEPEQDLNPTSDIPSNSVTANLNTLTQDHASPIFVPLDNQSTNFDNQQVQTVDDEKPVNIPDEEHGSQFDTNDQYKIPIPSKEPSTGLHQQAKNEHDHKNVIVIPTDELAGTQPDKTLPNDPFNTALNQPLYQPSASFDQEVWNGHDQKPSFIPAEEHNCTQPDKSFLNDEFNTSFSSNKPSTSADQYITSGQELHSNNPFTHQVTLVPPSSSFYYEDEKDHSPVLSQDVSPQGFPSVVPPLLIPLSRVNQYLPEGRVTFNTEMYIPLALKPAIVLKDQVAVMVFEQDDGHRPLQKHDQNATYLNQQPLSPLQEEQAQDENQAFQQRSNPFSEAFNDQKQHSQIYFNEEQQNQQRAQKRDEALQYPQQQQQQYPQQQQQQYPQQQKPDQATMQYQGQQKQQRQVYQHSTQPFQQPLKNSQQRDDERSQPNTSLSDSPYPDPSTSQQILRSSSLPHLPTNTQNQAPLTVTNDKPHSKPHSKPSVPGLKAPVWMRDEDCKNCSNCGRWFSVMRRKHHCRACGKIFCGDCCDQLAQLPYLGRRVTKICVSCTRAIRKAHSDLAKRKQEAKRQTRRRSQSSSVSQPTQGNLSSLTTSNNLLLYLPNDSISQTQSPTPSIPENNFSIPRGTNDAYQSFKTPEGNFNPASNLTQSRSDDPVQASHLNNGNSSNDTRTPVDSKSGSIWPGRKQDGGFVKNSWKIPSRPAGRTITWTELGSDASLDEQKKRFKNLNKALKNQEGAVIQAATMLSVSAKKIKVVVKQGLHEAWFLCSQGFASCGQQEIAFVLEKRLNEDVFPYEMLKVFRTLYSLILNQGERFEHGNYLAFNNPLLGSEENVGFIFITLNKASKLVQNLASFKTLLFGILLKQSELQCAKYMPTRLINALGVQQQCFPSPALSARDRPSVCNIEPNELFYSTFFALNQFLNYRIPQALIPGVHVLKSGSKVILELPFAYQTEIISVLDSLLVDESQPVTVPIAGDLVPESSGHFVYSPPNLASARRGFVVLQNSNVQTEPGNQYLAFSAILLVLTFGDACNSHTRFGIEVIEDGITVTLSDSQAREIRQAIYQGTNCAMSVGNSADSQEQFTLRWMSDTCPSILEVPTPITVVQPPKKPSRGNFPAVVPSPTSVRADAAGQTNVAIERVKTRDIEAAIQTKITAGEPQLAVSQLENDVRQACAGCLLTFANRLQSNAEKRLNLTLELGPGNYKKWKLGPNNQPINLARSLQLALKEIDVPDVNDHIVFVFNVILQKRN